MMDKFAQMTFPIPSAHHQNGLNQSERHNVCILWRQRLYRVHLG